MNRSTLSRALLLSTLSAAMLCVISPLRASTDPVDSINALLNSPSLRDTSRVILLIAKAEELEDNDQLEESLEVFRESVMAAKKAGVPFYTGIAYYEFGHYWRHRNQTDSAFRWYRSAIKPFKEGNHQFRKAKCYNRLARLHDNQYRSDSALQYFLLENDINKRLQRDEYTASCYNAMAILLKEQGNYKLSLANYLSSLRLNRQLGREKSIARNLNNIGNLFRAQGYYDRAREYYMDALSINEEIDYKKGIALNLLNLGRCDLVEHKPVEALERLNAGLQIARDEEDLERVSYALRLIGESFIQQEEHDEALFNLNEALRISIENELLSAEAKAHVLIGQVDVAVGNYDRAISLGEKALSFFESSLELEYTLLSVDLLSEAFEAKGDFENALMYSKEKHLLRDSLYNFNNAQSLSKLSAEKKFIETIGALENKALEEQMRAEREEQNTIFVAIGLAGMVVFGIFIFLNLRKSIQSNRTLRSLNEQIEEQSQKITRRNEELIKVNQDKNDLISIIAHDLRAPLTNIKSLLDLSMNEPESEKDQAKYLQMIERSCDRLLNMTDAVLDIGAADAQRLNVNPEITNIESIMESIEVALNGSAARKGIELKKTVEGKPVPFETDSTFLTPAISNLIDNAIKYSDADTTVELRIVFNEQNVVFEVKDEGPGISEDDLQRIFNPFQKLDYQPTGNEKSSGLGLHIVKRYVNALGGEISVESQLGKGSTFFIQLPISV